MNDSLGFSWEMSFEGDLVADYCSLSPEIENYPITEEEIAEIAYYDAMARWLWDEMQANGG